MLAENLACLRLLSGKLLKSSAAVPTSCNKTKKYAASVDFLLPRICISCVRLCSYMLHRQKCVSKLEPILSNLAAAQSDKFTWHLNPFFSFQKMFPATLAQFQFRKPLSLFILKNQLFTYWSFIIMLYNLAPSSNSCLFHNFWSHFCGSNELLRTSSMTVRIKFFQNAVYSDALISFHES